jgi:serine/threonine protein kinase
MSVPCPHCQHVITLKTVKPGKFKPTCPKCFQPFLLTVADDLSVSASVPPPGSSASAKAAGAADPNATAPPPASDPNATAPPTSVSRTSVKAKSATTEVPGARPAPAAKKPAAPPGETKAASGTKPAVGTKPTVPAKPAAKPAPPAAKKPASTDATEALPRGKPSSGAADADATGAWESSADAGDRTEVFTPGAEGRPADAGERTEAMAPADPGATTPPASDDPDRTDAVGASAKSKAPTRTQAKKKLPGKELAADAPKALGGYEILKQLGKGGMGTVYLARQVSLDRPVALKTMNSEWAADPRFLTRFTREAYAAAQLTHHNVLQIYDIGEDKGTHFFSMELVEGSNLGDLVKKSGKVDVEAAVGYILQAARGLKYAHDQGMVHRDIKPDNLMLNVHGIVKVADLGLVKTPQAAAQEEAAETGQAPPESAEVTAAGVAMGTPAYMAPEQSLNAAGVDQRADIYSLGCTLYALVTGRPPFQGKSALEVMSKHQTEPIIPPEKIVKHVPPEISGVVLKMLAKKLEDRYQDLAEVITDLEQFLGVKTTGPYSPKQEDVDALESAAKKFNEAPAARIRGILVPAFLGACILVAIVCFLFGAPRIAISCLGLGLFTGLFGFIACGMNNRSHLFQKTREMVFGNTWMDWTTWFVAVLLFVAVFLFLNMLHWWVGIFIIAAGLAATYFFIVDGPSGKQRQEPLEEVEKLLKSLRLKGVDEEALQQFVCKYAGERWEEMYEALFGYEALVQARQLWSRSATGRARPRFAPWREPILRWIEARQKSRKEARERRHLAKVERKALEAQGVSAAEAKARAEAAAESMVEQAEALKAELKQEATVAPESGRVVRPRRAALLAGRPGYRISDEPRPPKRRKPLMKQLFDTLLSPKVRFLAGAVLLGLCLMWATSGDNRLHESESWSEFTTKIDKAKPYITTGTLVDSLLNSITLGISGLLLIIGALLSEPKLIGVLLIGAIVMFFLPLVPLEGVGIDRTLLYGIAGGGALVLGAILGRFIK